MSEQHPLTPEQPASAEHLGSQSPERPQERPESSAEQARAEAPADIESIRNSIDTALQGQKEASVPADTSNAQLPILDKTMRNDALKTGLRGIRNHESSAERALNKLVHQKTVRAVSEVGARTVARPSGILTGGICAFIGSSFFFYLAHHVGFTYNYTLLTVFFVGGFAVGLLLESLLTALSHMFGARKAE